MLLIADISPNCNQILYAYSLFFNNTADFAHTWVRTLHQHPENRGTVRDILAVLGARCLQEWHYGRHELLVLVVHDPVAALGNPHKLGVREVAPVEK